MSKEFKQKLIVKEDSTDTILNLQEIFESKKVRLWNLKEENLNRLNLLYDKQIIDLEKQLASYERKLNS